MILPGVTRDSVLALARDHASGKRKLAGLPDKFTVSERNLTMPELVEASKDGSLCEVFGSGTAAIVSCVDGIGYEGELVKVPCGEDGRASSSSLALALPLPSPRTRADSCLPSQSATSPVSCCARSSGARRATSRPSGRSRSTPERLFFVPRSQKSSCRVALDDLVSMQQFFFFVVASREVRDS